MDSSDCSEPGTSFDEDYYRPSLMMLPDLVLYEICKHLKSPFDILNLGATCRRMYELTLLKSLWVELAFHWCEGLWPWLDWLPENPDPREWLLEFLSKYTCPPPGTGATCIPGNSESWSRVESPRFRCMLQMLRSTYSDRDEKHHPAVLFRRWLHDVGVFRRNQPEVNFSCPSEQLSSVCLEQLANLGQAAQWDLRRRKRRSHSTPQYYVHKKGVVPASQMGELFPSNPSGCLAPLLMCPSEAGFAAELTGTAGLTTCMAIVLGQQVLPLCLTGQMTVSDAANLIRTACQALRHKITSLPPNSYGSWKVGGLSWMVVGAAQDGCLSFEAWQEFLDPLGLHWRDMMCECAGLLHRYHGIDACVDQLRSKWRNALMPEVFGVLFGDELPSDSEEMVARVNLTDCDSIGGDNRKQEMAAAAFISSKGALVTWQLVGKDDY